MIRKLLRNPGLKIVSVLLAMLLWFLVVQIDDPQDTKTFSNIKVKLTNTDLLENQDKVYEILDGTDVVSVTVHAPKSIISQMRASDISAEADVNKITEISTIGINYTVSNVDVDYTIKGNHDFVKLNVENKKTKWVKVKYDILGDVADNYVISSVTPDQTMVEIAGPESVVEEISYAHVSLDVSEASSSLSANVEMNFMDLEGQMVDAQNVTKNVDYIHMDVEVLATKTVPFELQYTGTPAEGYLATGQTNCEPSSIVIAGTPSTLASIAGIKIPDNMIDISEATENVKTVIPMKDLLPENVKLAGVDNITKVTTYVYIEKQKQKELHIPGENISFDNIPEGYKIELQDDFEVTLVITGLANSVDAVNEASIKATVNVEEWMEENDVSALKKGNMDMYVSFKLGDNVNYEDKTRIKVNITEK